MRCEKCNVDLPESYKLCPLCGSEASDTPARLEGFDYVPYSAEAPSQPEKHKKEKTAFTVEKIKAYFNL